jgi:hypothetical protein
LQHNSCRADSFNPLLKQVSGVYISKFWRSQLEKGEEKKNTEEDGNKKIRGE